MAIEDKTKVTVSKEVKREIDLLAANEQRPVYDLVEEMVEIYKSAKTGKRGPVDVSDVIRYKPGKKPHRPTPIETVAA